MRRESAPRPESRNNSSGAAFAPPRQTTIALTIHDETLYADHFVLPLPPGHRFPMEKYSRLRERLLASGHFATDDFRVPDAATDTELLRAHDAGYMQRVVRGTLGPTKSGGLASRGPRRWSSARGARRAPPSRPAAPRWPKAGRQPCRRHPPRVP